MDDREEALRRARCPPTLFSLAWFKWQPPNPTLNDVLYRYTMAPVDLFSFYIYMRDQQRAVDYLDFWLDVSQHTSLCRLYVGTLRRSLLAETSDNEGASKRSSAQGGIDDASAYDGVGPNEKRVMNEQRVSAVMREDHGGSLRSRTNSQSSDFTPSHHSRPSGGVPTSSPGAATTSSPLNQLQVSSTSSGGSPGNNNNLQPSTEISSSPSPESAEGKVHREDVFAKAVHILETFVLDGAEREIILPAAVKYRIIDAIKNENRADPLVFVDAKDYVFQAMDRDAFSGFLEAKAMGNLVPASIMARLITGLVCLFAGLWTAFVLIFLNYSRSTRCWLILPFTLGTYFLHTYEKRLDPILAFVGLSEYTFFNFSKIREKYVHQRLIKRGISCLLSFLLTDLILCLIFILVPGHRL